MLFHSSDICFGVLMIFLLFLSLTNRHPERHKEYLRSLTNLNRSYLEEYLKFSDRFEKTLQRVGHPIREGQEYSNIDLTDNSNYNNSAFLEKCLGMTYHDQSDKNAVIKRMRTLFQKFGVKPCSLPLQVDWRKAGIVTEIRNQGKCGSCYAHSVIASIESRLALEMNLSTPMEFSVQQMLDCSGEFSKGCSGGDTCELLEWLETNRVNILPSNLYPASHNARNKCRARKILKKLGNNAKTVRIKQYACFNFTDNEHELLAVIARVGPITTSVDASLWHNYLGGIIKYHCNGPPNHAVQIVGYDLTVENPYYIVRNSWGCSFGNDGYAKVAVGYNTCGIASEVALFNIALV